MNLESMTQDQLYELAITCDEEPNGYHEDECKPCQAWALWNERDREDTAQANQRDQDRLDRKITELATELSECYNITRADAQHIIKMTMEAFNA